MELVDGVKLVTEAPEFLGLNAPTRPMPRAAAVAPESTSGRVVVVVDERGKIRFLACPEKADEAELGGLMADLLATSGRLWRQPYEMLAGMFQKALGVELADWVGGKAGKGWSAQVFKAGVQKSLQEGRFPVTVFTNDTGKAIQGMLGYLRNMNLDVAVLGYRCARGEGIETIVPVSTVPDSSPRDGDAAEGAATVPEQAPVERKPERATPGRIPHGDQHTPTVEFSGRRKARPNAAGEPFPSEGVSPEQQKILAVLIKLDELGLFRHGFEYFTPGYDKRDSAEGTVVVSVDEHRWPFPKPDEVIVVVNTGADHLAGYLRLSSEEIEEFLASLPRVQRKEHRGALLLRATTINEAEQLVNELRALREVAGTGV